MAAADQNKKNTTLLVLSMLALVACSTPEETAQNHLQTGKEYLEQGELDKALLEFKTANQDGRHAEAYYYMALLDEKQNNPAAMRENLHSCLLLDDGMVPAKLKLAQVELGFGNLPEATKQIDGILISHPDNIPAQLLKAVVLMRQNKNPDALTLLDSILVSQPDNAEALTEKTEYFLRQNDIEQALATADKALILSPNFKPLHLLRINIFGRTRNTDGLIAEFKELIRLEPGNDNFKIRLATLYANNGKLPEAETVLREMVNQKPNRVENKLILLQFLESHAPDRLATEYQQWLDNTNNNKRLPADSKSRQLLELSKWLIAHDLFDLDETGLKQIVENEKDTTLNLNAQTDLAEISFMKKQYAEAEAAADNILKQNSDFIQASFLKARINLVQSKPDEAIKILNGLVWTKDKSGDLYTYLGMAYSQKNDAQQADKNFKQALELNPANRAAFFPVYLSYLKTNQKDSAKQMLDKALKARPHLDWLLVIKAELDIQERDWDEAKNTVQLLSMFSKNQAVSNYLYANILQGSQQFDKAIPIYQQVLEMSPDYTDAYVNLLRCYEALKARDKGIAYLEAFHEKHPDSIKTVLLLGDLYNASKELSKTRKLYTEQLQHTPKTPILYINLARIAVAEHKKPDEVKAILTEGLTNNPDEASLAIAMAGWYEDTGDLDSARKIYEPLWDKHPDSDIISNNLASILLNSTVPADVNRGVVLAQRLKNSESLNFLDTYGWSLVKSGQTAKAIDVLKSLTSKAPEMADARYHLGVAFLKDGKKNQAIIELKQAIASSDKYKRNFTGKPEAITLLQEAGGQR